MTFLLDVNVLFILHQPRHAAFRVVSRWFASKAAESFATCAITQTGVMRLLIQGVGLDQFTFEEARMALGAFAKHPSHIFWPDAPPFLDVARPFAKRVQGYRQITDGYLIGLAVRNNAKLATLDLGIRQLAGMEFAGYLEIIQ